MANLNGRQLTAFSPFIPSFSQPATNRRVLLARRPRGVPQANDFVQDEVEIDRPGPGQILVRNIYLSVDPAQRGWASDTTNYSAPVPIGGPMRSLAIGCVVESRDPDVAVGDFVYGWFGWQDYAVASRDHILVHIGQPKISLSAYAGVLGINGMTAWLAFNTLGRPSAGDTLVVSTAAGAVGSIVGQLGKAAGCRTLGLTGDADKVRRCTDQFGYVRAIDYKSTDVAEALAEAAPEGVDIYFDNVGGAMLDILLRQMRVGGRVIQCGTASVADWTNTPQGPRNEREVLTRRLSWNGFVIFDHHARFAEAQAALIAMINAGTLVYLEDISTGFSHAPGALQEIYAGQNSGKKLIMIG